MEKKEKENTAEVMEALQAHLKLLKKTDLLMIYELVRRLALGE